MSDKFPQLFLGSVVTVGLIVLMFYLAYTDKTDTDTFKILIGGIMVGFSGIMGYYFGSSAGSRAKDDTISAIAHKSVPDGVKVPPTATVPRPLT